MISSLSIEFSIQGNCSWLQLSVELKFKLISLCNKVIIGSMFIEVGPAKNFFRLVRNVIKMCPMGQECPVEHAAGRAGSNSLDSYVV